MNFFVEFETVTATGDGLLIEGTVPADQLAIAAGPGLLSLGEMASEAKVGRLRGCSVVDGVLRVAAEIWDRIAIAKAVERVYRGLLLVCVPAGDGEVVVERCALVDRPDALAKGGSGDYGSIHVTEVFKMAMRHDAPARPAANPYRRIEFGGLADPVAEREAQERAVDLIRVAKSRGSPQAQPVRGFFDWLQARSRARYGQY